MEQVGILRVLEVDEGVALVGVRLLASVGELLQVSGGEKWANNTFTGEIISYRGFTGPHKYF